MTRFNSLRHLISPVLTMLTTAFIMGGCKRQGEATLPPPVNVDIQVMHDNNYGDFSKRYSGTVESAEATTVSFSVPGTITKIYVDAGQKVNKGQLLAKIKDESLLNTRNITQAELDEARDAYLRLKKLHDADALPEIKWVEVQSKLKQAENAADLADRAVKDAAIYSPISGYVSEKLSDDGQTVIATQPILRLVNVDDIRIVISVPEDEIAGFSNGCQASVVFDGLDSLTVKGKVSQKSVVADPLTRTYSVKFSIPNTSGKMLPGMIGTVKIEPDACKEAIDSEAQFFTLPSQAILLNADNRQFVWIIKNGKAERRFVTSDEFSTDGITVKSGITKGDSVIVAGMQKVSTGTKVTATSR